MLGEIVRVVAALAVTLGLIGLAVAAYRRYGPETLLRLQGSRATRRLAVIETLVLDPARRLVLVRCDAEERLILLGEGQLIPSPPSAAPETKR
jgi:flagellar protein FliO/FliZ